MNYCETRFKRFFGLYQFIGKFFPCPYFSILAIATFSAHGVQGKQFCRFFYYWHSTWDPLNSGLSKLLTRSEWPNLRALTTSDKLRYLRLKTFCLCRRASPKFWKVGQVWKSTIFRNLFDLEEGHLSASDLGMTSHNVLTKQFDSLTEFVDAVEREVTNNRRNN